ncbi:MAG: YeeE/YedE thiosulfate transporter family protein [Deferribacterales bacterium]
MISRVITAKTWTPWVTGALTGILAALCCVCGKTVLGASGGFITAASFMGKYLNMPWQDLLYFKFVKPPVISFQLIQFAGMIAGSFTAAYLSSDFKLRLTPDEGMGGRTGSDIIKRWVTVFFCGILIEFGASVAGGCTSGLGISGIIQQSPAGFLFFATAFAAAVPTAFIVKMLR